MTGAAAGYFIAGSSWLHRRHPLTKLLGVLFVLVAAFLLPPVVGLPVLAVALVVSTVSARLGGALVRSLRIPAVLVVSIVVVNALFFPGGRDVLLQVGPLAITREGLTFGLVSAGRLLVAFMASVLFLFTTLADDLLEALVTRGVSHRIAFVVLSAVQLVPRMQDRANGILAAQQARGLAVSGSLERRVRALVPLVGPVLLGALMDVRERTFALEARGFGARPGRTAYRVVPDSGLDRLLRLVLGAATVAVVGAAITGVVR
ncbi:MAG: energy-coupling factor transporter transmembrane component T [Candidatus Limnocylindrales bacterium]